MQIKEDIMAESKVKQTKNSISSIVIDRKRERESRLIQKTKNGRTHIIFEVYEKGKLIEKKEYIF